MNLNFSRVRSTSDIIVSSSLIIAGAALMFLPYGTGLNIAGFFFLLTGVLFLALFKSMYKLEGTEETIPTLAQTLALIDGQVPILLEYKMDKVDTDVCAYSHELLKDYTGDYAIQSFHPFALFWYRQNAKDIPRGILAKNFLRDNEATGEESDIIDFLTTNLMLNVLGYPDFIAFDWQDADYFALKLCRMMGAPTSTWTLKDPAHYEQVKGEFDLYTFEGFAMQ